MQAVVGGAGEHRGVVLFDGSHELCDPAEVVHDVRSGDLAGERASRTFGRCRRVGHPHHDRRGSKHRPHSQRDHAAAHPRNDATGQRRCGVVAMALQTNRHIEDGTALGDQRRRGIIGEGDRGQRRACDTRRPAEAEPATHRDR